MITLINHQGLKTVSGIQIQTPSPSIGLAYIGAYLKKHGIDYTAIDACGEALDQIRPYTDDSQDNSKTDRVMIQGLTLEQVIQRVPKETSIFGFTCLFSHCWPLVLDMARALKPLFPRAIFIAGGEHPSALPEQILKSRLFDIVALGEGEETMLELAQKIYAGESWKGLDGISYLADDGAFVRNKARVRMLNVDELPYPDWDSWSLQAYIQTNQVTGINLGSSMPILGSRGCPYECTFCSNADMWTQRYLMRSAAGLVDEMAYMKAKYHVTGFTFMDSTFVINRKKTLDFARELALRNLSVTYQLPAGTRCEAFDEELAFELERSGLRNFAFAPESGSEMILEAIKKKVSLEKFISAVKVVLKTKMTVGCFFVIGFPEDTRTTLKQTLSLVRKLALIGVHDATVSKFTPYPGSEYFRNLFSEEEISENSNELRSVISFYSSTGKSYAPTIASRQLHLWMIWIYLNFYVISFTIRPWRVFRNFWEYFSKGVENARYMRFFTEMIYLRHRWNRSS